MQPDAEVRSGYSKQGLGLAHRCIEIFNMMRTVPACPPKIQPLAATSNPCFLLVAAMAGAVRSFRQVLELLVVFWNAVMRDS